MKTKKIIILLVLVAILSSCFFIFDSEPIEATEDLSLKNESLLTIREYNNKEVLLGFPEQRTLKDLLSNLYSSGNIYVTKDGNVLRDKDIVSTGTLLSCGNDKLYVVIKGDANGDGIVDASDFLMLKRHFQEAIAIDDVYFLAADTYENGEIDSTDYLQLRKYFLGEFELFPNKDAVTLPEVYLEIVRNTITEYKIRYADASTKVAAFTLQEIIQKQLGATLMVENSNNVSNGEKVIYIKFEDESKVGNYGYSVKATDTYLTVSAATLAGFDNAFTRLMLTCSKGQTFSVPGGYVASQKLNWETNYTLEGNDYNFNYNSDIFYNDKNDSVAYVSNAMWHMFGAIDDGQDLVYRFGNEPTWFEWMTEKNIWSGNTQYINELKRKIRCFPQTSTGYMWSWSQYPYWQVDNCYSIHYDGTFRYIAAVYDIISWEGDTTFLNKTDTDTVSGQYSSVDSSKGRTVLAKTEACLNYILEYLYGKEGYIRLTEESTYLNKDGSKRFDYVYDTGEYCWNNTGKPGASASNYWDNLCFGNYDAYSNALLYNSLKSMAGIYRMLGSEYQTKAENCESLAETVKIKFNELYWSEEKGRYIACIDTDGVAVDYGLTFLNYEILKYGLADEYKASLIFDWIDGKRVVEGDDRTGEDIFSYGKLMELVNAETAESIKAMGLRLAAVSNTIAIDNKNVEKAWWHAPAGIDVWNQASYGKHLENGGYIFYTVFYELMARTEYVGAQASTERLAEIAKVYEYNRLKSDAAAIGSTNWLEGLIGEFPESGLVPTTYLYSFLGISAEYDGLHFEPKFNDVYEYMGVKKVMYDGKTYGFQAFRDGSCTITPSSGNAVMKLFYKPERFTKAKYRVTINKTDGTSKSSIVATNENGIVNISLNEKKVKNITIQPIIGE